MCEIVTLALMFLPVFNQRSMLLTNSVVLSPQEETRQKVRDLVSTSSYQRSWRARKKVEVMFSELKQQVNLRQRRLPRLRHMAEQVLLAVTAQNVRRLVRFLAPPTSPPCAVVA